MTIDLFIRGIKADTGDSHEFIRNFKRTIQFCDLENPTKVTTDYSYSINLPGTPTNKRIFGYIDTHGTDPNAFNPAVPYEFLLNIDGVLWLHGNVQLTKAVVNNGETIFTCSFYESRHEKIVSLGNKKLKDLVGLSDNDYFYHYLDREAMANFWFGEHQFSNIIRYIPTRAGFYQDFQNDKVMRPVFNNADPPVLTGYSTIDLGTDMDEYAMSEYRVEYQRPALSLNYLMRCIMSENDISVDASLMNSPFIQYGWAMLPPMSIEESTGDNVLGTFSKRDASINKPGSGYGQTGFNISSMRQTTASDPVIIAGARITPDDNCTMVSIECVCRITGTKTFSPLSMLPIAKKVYMRDAFDGPLLDVVLAGTNATTINANEGSKTFNIKKTGDAEEAPYWYDSSVDPSSYTRHYVYHNTTIDSSFPGWSDDTWTPCRFTFSMTPGVQTGTPHLVNFYLSRVPFSWGTSPSPIMDQYVEQLFSVDNIKFEFMPITALSATDLSRVMNGGYSGKTIVYEAVSSNRSPLYVNVNSFIPDEMSQRDILVDLSKMTGCIWDETSTGISVKSRNRFFDGYTIKDWSDKLDRSSDFEMKPLTFDKAVYTFGYKKGESFLENQYEDRTGREYGKQYVNTGYGFNAETEALYESTAYNTVMCKGERRCVRINYQYEPNSTLQTSYELPMIEQNDNGSPKEGLRYLMDCGVTTLEKGEFVYITQDSSYMFGDTIGGKCWYDTTHYSNAPAIANNIVICSAIPLFCTRKGYASFDWAKSSYSYSKETDTTYDGSTCLYPRFWSDYLDEMYDARNRVVTASFALDTLDLLNFSFKDFVTIDGRLYHPNKITDYDITGESLTKVELVEVHNLQAYVNGQNWNFELPVNSPANNTTDASAMGSLPIVPSINVE